MKRFIVFCLLCLLLSVSLPAAENIKILVIHSWHSTIPWTAAFENGLAEAARSPGMHIEFYTETLDVSRFGSKEDNENFSSYFKVKYRNIPFDAVLADSDFAAEFVNTYLQLPQTIPIVHYTSHPLPAREGLLCLNDSFNDAARDTLLTADFIMPRISKIVIIAGDGIYTGVVKALAQSLIAGERGIPVIVMENFSFEELLASVSLLSSDTAVFFTPVVTDKMGNTVIPRDLLSKITAVSPAPVFSFWKTLMGTGMVGGRLLSAEKTAKSMVFAAIDYLENGTFGASYNVLENIIDYQAAKKYSLDISRLSETTEIINQPVSFFMANYEKMMVLINSVIAFLLFTTVTVLIIVFRSNKKLERMNDELEDARRTAESISKTDTLTGLINRRGAESLVSYEQKRADKNGTPLSLAVFDIDFFKKVNDTYGHDTGDHVLSAVAKTIRENSRSSDTAARWGGEEFLILMPDTTEENARHCAEKIRRKVSEIVFDECSPVTISAGVSQFIINEKFDCWFKRADAALYQAKNTGRNKVVLSSDLTEEMLSCTTHYSALTLYLEWRDEYLTGEEKTDGQHQSLFETANCLLGMIVNKAAFESISLALDDLRYDVEHHFADEEKYLSHHGCPIMDFHRSEHHRLVQTLAEHISHYKAHPADAYSFIPFICQELILNHIVTVDVDSFNQLHK